LKKRHILPTDTRFQTPEPLVLNEYWAFFPVPQKALFRDLLNLSPAEPVEIPAKPEISNDELRRLEYLEKKIIDLQKDRANAQFRISQLDKVTSSLETQKRDELKTRVAEIDEQLDTLEVENQGRAFEHSRLVYQWSMEKDAREAEKKLQLQTENDRKTAILEHVAHELKSYKKHINNVQNAALEVELNKSIEELGGLDGEIPEITPETDEHQASRITEMHARVKCMLDKVNTSSTVKGKLSVNQALIRKLMNPLQAHVPQKKGKYEKSGQFTKEKRAAKTSSARSYQKTGKHINDYQNPRDRKQRDWQIQERARKLGVSTEDFRQSVLGTV
jgi:hypothetical protein